MIVLMRISNMVFAVRVLQNIRCVRPRVMASVIVIPVSSVLVVVISVIMASMGKGDVNIIQYLEARQLGIGLVAEDWCIGGEGRDDLKLSHCFPPGFGQFAFY